MLSRQLLILLRTGYNRHKRAYNGGRTAMVKKAKIVQTKNPKTGRYVKIDRAAGRIIDTKKSPGPYKNVPVARKRSK